MVMLEENMDCVMKASLDLENLQFSGLGSRAAFESPTACFRPTTARRLDSTAASNRVTPCRAYLHSGESIQGITATQSSTAHHALNTETLSLDTALSEIFEWSPL